MTVKDKVAIVTGASSGIGRAMACCLAQHGARVVLAARNRDGLMHTAAMIAAESDADVAIVEFDATDPTAARILIDAAVSRFGTLDVLLANAGVYVAGDAAEGDPNAWDQLIATNVSGTFRLVREALPHLLEQGAGDIVLTSSVSGHQAIHWEPVYSASKHAVQSFVHGVRRQIGPRGVRIGAIAPGIVLNELWRRDYSGSLEALVERGEGILSEDVADAVLFMITRPPHVTVRDLVILPRSQDI